MLTMVRKYQKRIFAWFLSAIMAMTMCLTSVYANEAEEQGLCEHHPVHTAECGYVAEVPETPCRHVHADECYVLVESCQHIHTDACYAATDTEDVVENESDRENTGIETDNPSTEPTEETPSLPSIDEDISSGVETNESPILTEEAGDKKEDAETTAPTDTVIESVSETTEVAPAVEVDVSDTDAAPIALGTILSDADPVLCDHVCTTESGCIQTVLDCPHERGEHDASCGYAAGQPGTPCRYVCEECNLIEEPQKCNCEIVCTEDTRNENCPVCSATENDLTLCGGAPFMVPMAFPQGSYEAFDAARTTSDGIFEFRVRPAGSNQNGVTAYCFNYHLLNPDMISMGVVGPYYKLSDVSNATFVEYAQGERDAETLKQDVMNVVWNGYPYYGGDWQGVSSNDEYEKQLLDIYCTQSAVWYYTDSKSVEDNSLIASAEANPAPANFILDLYDGTYADGSGLQLYPEYERYQNLLAVHDETEDLKKDTVTVQVTKQWQYANGQAYEGKTPSISFQLFEGDISAGEEPLQTISLPEGSNKVSFTLLDDGKYYTLREVMSGDTESFQADSDKIIDLGAGSDEIDLTFTNTYTSKGGFDVTKTVVGDEEGNAQSYSFIAKLTDENNAPYNGEYTIKEAGNDFETKTYTAAGITFTLKNGETCQIKDIPEGIHYTVEEVSIPIGYRLYNIQMNGTVLNGVTTVADDIRQGTSPEYTFVNMRIPEPNTAPLIVQKNVVDAPEDMMPVTFSLKVELFTAEDAPYVGTYTLNGSKNQLTYDRNTGIQLALQDKEYAMIGGLPENLSYRITETPTEDYISVSGTLEGTLEAPGVWTGYVNRYVQKEVPRTLTLKKLVDGAPTNAGFVFEVTLEGDAVTYTPTENVQETGITSSGDKMYTVTLKHGESVTFSGMPENYTYLIKEVGSTATNIITEDISIDAQPEEEGTYTSSNTVTSSGVQAAKTNITYTNFIVPTVSLSFTKEIDSTVTDTGKPYTFHLQLWREDTVLAENKTLPALLIDDEGQQTEMPLTFDANDIAIVRLLPNETLKLQGLPSGTYTYKFTEVEADDYDVKINAPIWVSVDEAAKTVSQEGDMKLNRSTSITFTNQKAEEPEPKDGGFTVSKLVTGDGDQEHPWNFVVTLSDKTISGTYGDMEFKDGVTTFTLRHGDTKTANGLPADITYTVEETEANQNGYDTTSVNAKGQIEAGRVKAITFTNHKDDDPSTPGGGSGPKAAKVHLKVEKTLDGKQPEDGLFTFILKDEDGKTIQTQTNDGGNVTFDTLSFKKAGTYRYTITEKMGDRANIVYDDSVYTVEIHVTRSGDYHATVSYEKDGKAYTGTPVFENTTGERPAKDVTSVTVNKVWAGDTSVSRPAQAEMQLYRNGVAYGDAVTLNAENGWRYTWVGLDENAVWTVDEVIVPNGYVKTVQQEESVWTITNAQTPPIDPNEPDEPGTPNDPDKPNVPDEPTKPDQPNEPADKESVQEVTLDKPNRSIDSNTPKTDDPYHNQIWLMLMLGSVLGMAATAHIGLRIHRKKQHKS